MHSLCNDKSTKYENEIQTKGIVKILKKSDISIIDFTS